MTPPSTPSVPAGPARLSDAEVAAIRARSDAATAGPWEICDRGTGCDYDVDGQDAYDLSGRQCGMFGEKRDAEFVAHARADIPRLLADRAALEAENARLREAMRWVPVTERLPIEGQKVLVLSETNGCAPYVDTARMEHGDWCNDNWHCDVPVKGGDIAHWRTLPGGVSSPASEGTETPERKGE